MAVDPNLKALGKLVGEWTTEATHPMVPGVIVHGSSSIEWLEGGHFLIHRARTDRPDFPDSISIIGYMDQDRAESDDGSSEPGQLRMHYFDQRGVFRIFDSGIDATAWKFWREAPGFSQRFTGTFSDDGDVIVGQSQLRRDDVHWVDDLAITYRRRSGR